MHDNSNRTGEVAVVAAVSPVGNRWLTASFIGLGVNVVLFILAVIASIVILVAVIADNSIDRKNDTRSDSAMEFSLGSYYVHMDEEGLAVSPSGSDTEKRGEVFKSGWSGPLVLLGIIIIVSILSGILFTVVSMTALYKGWKAVQPLKTMTKATTGEMIAPAAAVGLLFVPLFHYYWIYPAYLALVDNGKEMAELRQLSYTGPSKALVSAFIILLWVNAGCLLSGGILLFPLFFVPPLALGGAILLCLITWKINNMVRVLGAPFSFIPVNQYLS